jgi:hypothetical protein
MKVLVPIQRMAPCPSALQPDTYIRERRTAAESSAQGPSATDYDAEIDDSQQSFPSSHVCSSAATDGSVLSRADLPSSAGRSD